MLLRVFLLASLLVVAFADEYEDDHNEDHEDDIMGRHFGCCSREDRRELQHCWQSIYESSFTERKVMFAMAIFNESVIQLSHHHHHHHCRCRRYQGD